MAEEQLDLQGERFLVISGDALTDAELTHLVRFHEEKNSESTMVLKSVENPLDFGIVVTEEDGRISRFLEKPTWGQVFSDTVNAGIYLLEESVLSETPYPEKDEYDFSKELFPKLLEAGRTLYGYIMDEYWETWVRWSSTRAPNGTYWTASSAAPGYPARASGRTSTSAAVLR